MKKILSIIFIFLVSCESYSDRLKEVCQDCKKPTYEDITHFENGEYAGKYCYSYTRWRFDIKQCETKSINVKKCKNFINNSYDQFNPNSKNYRKNLHLTCNMWEELSEICRGCSGIYLNVPDNYKNGKEIEKYCIEYESYKEYNKNCEKYSKDIKQCKQEVLKGFYTLNPEDSDYDPQMINHCKKMSEINNTEVNTQ